MCQLLAASQGQNEEAVISDKDAGHRVEKIFYQEWLLEPEAPARTRPRDSGNDARVVHFA